MWGGFLRLLEIHDEPVSLVTPASPEDVVARLREQTRPPRMGKLRPGEEVAFLGPSGYSRARAVVTVSSAPIGSVVTGALRFGRLERFSVLLGSVWFVIVTLRLLLSVVTGGGLIPTVALVLIGALGYASRWARARDRRRMRQYLGTLLAPAPAPPPPPPQL